MLIARMIGVALIGASTGLQAKEDASPVPPIPSHLSEFEVPALPSGEAPQLYDLILDVRPDGQNVFARFRFVLDRMGQTDGSVFADIEQDFDVLCREMALPIVLEGRDHVDIIVISMSDRMVEFGSYDPDVIQFFEAYRLENADCIWEGF